MISRKKRIFLGVLLGLALVVAACFLIPGIRVRLLGFFHGEPFYDGLPAGAWEQKLQSEKPGGPAFEHLKKGGKPALPVLMEIAFARKSAGANAAQGLLVLQGEAAVPSLVKALKKPAEGDRILAAVILGEMGGKAKSAVDNLVRLVEDPVESVRFAGMVALQRIGPDASDAIPDLILVLEGKGKSKSPEWRAEAAKALARIGPSAKAAVPALIACLKIPDSYLNQQSCLAVGLIGKDSLPAVPALIELLQNTGSPARGAAAFALGRIGPGAKQAVPALILALEEKGQVMREAAREALVRMGPEAAPAVPTLLKVFGQKAPIKEIGPPAIPQLIQLLPDPDPKKPVQALPEFFLKKFGKAATPAMLEALAKDKNPSVRRAIASLLRGPTWGEANDVVPGLIAVLGDKHRQISEEAAASILSFRQEAQPFLEQALRDKDQAIRLESVQLLGRLGLSARSSSKLLSTMLKEDDTALRLAGVRALGNMNVHPKDAVPILFEALKNKNLPQLTLAQLAVHGRAAKNAVPLIGTILDQDADWKMRRLAAYALARIGSEREIMLPALKKALHDKHEMVRAEAAEALGSNRFAADDIVPLLTKLLDDKSPEVKAGAIAGLGQLGKAAKSAVPLIHKIAKASAEPATGKGGRDLRAICVIALGNIGPAAKEAAPLLLTWLAAAKSEDVRAELIQALGQMQAKEASKILRPLVQKEKGYEGIVAALALWRIEQSSDALAFLEGGLKAKSGRSAFIESLGKVGAPARKSVPALIDILQRDPDLDRRALAAEALGRIGPSFARPAIKALTESLKVPHAGLRIQAAIALAPFEDDAKDAVTSLLRLLEDPESPQVRQAATDALRRIDPEALR